MLKLLIAAITCTLLHAATFQAQIKPVDTSQSRSAADSAQTTAPGAQQPSQEPSAAQKYFTDVELVN